MFVGIPRETCLWEGFSDFLDFLSNGRSICVVVVREKAQSGGPTGPNSTLCLRSARRQSTHHYCVRTNPRPQRHHKTTLWGETLQIRNMWHRHRLSTTNRHPVIFVTPVNTKYTTDWAEWKPDTCLAMVNASSRTPTSRHNPQHQTPTTISRFPGVDGYRLIRLMDPHHIHEV